MRQKLTNALVRDTLPLPNGKQLWVKDLDPKGRSLFVLISPKGAKTFYLCRRINGKLKRYVLGRFPEISVKAARDLASELNIQIDSGKLIDTTSQRKEKQKRNFEWLFNEYLENHAKKYKKTWKTDISMYENHLKQLGDIDIYSITRAAVTKLHTKIGNTGKTYLANRCMALARSVFNYGIKELELEINNPVQFIKFYKEQSRERFLSKVELPKLLISIEQEESGKIRDFIFLALLTGQRKGNLLSMQWKDIDFDLETWKIPETKNGKSHEVPLLKEAIQILQRRKDSGFCETYVFPGKSSGHMNDPKRGWKRILKRAGIENLRIHDLRRSLASWMAITGTDIQVIGKTLNHLSPETTAIYARLNSDAVRDGMEKAVDTMLSFKG